MITEYQGLNKKCLFDCIYCFTKENYNTNGQRELSCCDLETIDIIQPFCDYDVFACSECNWKDDINKYAAYGKILSFATKGYISSQKALYLSEVNKNLMRLGAFLHVAVSITVIEKASEIEKKAPCFEVRCKSLMNVHTHGIPSSVIIRPVLPVLSEHEISVIIDRTYKYCDNYIYGPLFMNSEISEYLLANGIKISTIPLQQTWLDYKPTFQVFYSDDYSKKIDYLKSYCKSKNMNIWRSNREALEEIQRSIIEKKKAGTLSKN